MVEGAQAITDAIRAAEGPAICAYVTAGYPTMNSFPEILHAVAEAADVVEIGVPFTDPMADGLTIQASSRVALDNGVSLCWLVESLQRTTLSAPHVLMGYYNPFLQYGFERLVGKLRDSGTAGLIVPDLPLEESGEIRDALESSGLGLVQLVTPRTSETRLARVIEASRGFVYAVSTTGVTGGETAFPDEALAYFDRVKSHSALPVLAGFGVRTSAQVAALAPHVDGVVVGSALIEVISRGDDPSEFLNSLRASTTTDVGA